MALDRLSVGSSEVLVFDTTDPDAASDGNEAWLPLVLLVDRAGAARLAAAALTRAGAR